METCWAFEEIRNGSVEHSVEVCFGEKKCSSCRRKKTLIAGQELKVTEKKMGTSLFFPQIATDSLMTVPIFPLGDLSEDPGNYTTDWLIIWSRVIGGKGHCYYEDMLTNK